MKQLVDNDYLLTPANSQTNLCIDFDTQQDFDALQLHCVYSPKTVEDPALARQLIEASIAKYMPRKLLPVLGNWKDYIPLNNLITLSVDYNGAYLGAAHRHMPDQTHILSEGFSSPGFLCQKAAAGHWRAVLNVHALVSDEVRCHITISGIEPGDNIPISSSEFCRKDGSHA